MDWLIRSAVVLTALGLAYGGLAALGAWRWSGATRALVARLDATRQAGSAARYDAVEIAGLPDPVRRCFELTLTDGQAMVRAANLAMTGTFSLSLVPAVWKPFTSRQHITTDRPGFVWDGQIMMFPLVPIRVHDAYVGGSGRLQPTILGLFSVGTLDGEGEIARGELMRWFAEAVWVPTALLPRAGVSWAAVDATSARATLTDGALTLTLLFRFGADGLIASVASDARTGMLDGVAVSMPWECRLSNYQIRDGMRVPLSGEALYITPEGPRSYFRGTLTSIAYQFES